MLEAGSGLHQIPNMGLFAKIVYDFQCLTILTKIEISCTYIQ